MIIVDVKDNNCLDLIQIKIHKQTVNIYLKLKIRGKEFIKFTFRIYFHKISDRK